MFGGVSNNQGQGLHLLVENNANNSFTLDCPQAHKALDAIEKSALRALTISCEMNEQQLLKIFRSYSCLSSLKIVSSPNSTADSLLKALGEPVNKFGSREKSSRLTKRLPDLKTLIFMNLDTVLTKSQFLLAKKNSNNKLPFPFSNLYGRSIKELRVSNYPSIDTESHNQTFGQLIRRLPELEILDLRFSAPSEKARQQLWDAIDPESESNKDQLKQINTTLSKLNKSQLRSNTAEAKLACQHLKYLNLSGWHLSAADCSKLVALIKSGKLPRLTYLVLAETELPALGLQDLVHAFAHLQQHTQKEEIIDEDWVDISLDEPSAFSEEDEASDGNNSSSVTTAQASPKQPVKNQAPFFTSNSTSSGLLDLVGCKLVDETNQALSEEASNHLLKSFEALAPAIVRLKGSELPIEDNHSHREAATDQSFPVMGYQLNPVEFHFNFEA